MIQFILSFFAGAALIAFLMLVALPKSWTPWKRYWVGVVIIVVLFTGVFLIVML